MNRKLHLGNVPNGQRLTLTPEQRTTHVRLIGAPGSGKTKAIEHQVRQDIDDPGNPGIIVVDPHGSLYDSLVPYCAWRRPRRPVYLVNLSVGDPVQVFNPFLNTDGEPSVLADRAIEATIKSFGAAHTDQTPRLERTLRMLYQVIIERGLSIAEAELLFDYSAHETRRYLTAGTTVEAEWHQLDQAKTPTQFEDQIGSAKNRLQRFYGAKNVRRFLSVTNPRVNLDLGRFMHAGGILLVNLKPSEHLSPMNARLFGTLLVSRLFDAARRRELPNGHPPRPCYAYLDEAQNFLTVDVAEMLAQGRKMGLCLTLAHQTLEQLRAEDPRILAALVGACRTQIVFNVGSNADALELTGELYPEQLNLNEAKRVDTTRHFRPVTRWVDVQSRTTAQSRGHTDMHTRSVGSSESHTDTHTRSGGSSESHTDTHTRSVGSSASHAEGAGHASGFTSGSSFMSGEAFSSPDSPLFGLSGTHITSSGSVSTDAASDVDSSMTVDSVGTVEGQSDGDAYSVGTFDSQSDGDAYSVGTFDSQSDGDAYSENTSRGTTTTPAHITDHEEYEEQHVTVYTLEEQRQRYADRLRRLPPRVCMVRLPDGTAHRVTVAEVKPVLLSRRRVAEYEAQAWKNAGALSAEHVEQLIQERHRQIKKTAAISAAPFDDDNSDPLNSPELPYEPITARPAGNRAPFSKPGRKARPKQAIRTKPNEEDPAPSE